jgi:hypothetical protein
VPKLDRIRVLAIVVVCASFAGVLTPSAARACAACSIGDPTLTVMGNAQTFEGRLRVALELQHRTDAVGREGIDRLELSEQRAAASVAWAPLRWLMLSASVPVLRRVLNEVSLAETTVFNLGDAEVRARGVVYQDTDLQPTHILAIAAGVKLPTAPIDDNAINPDFEPGSGSWDPLGGITYSLFVDDWSLYLSELGYLATESRAGWTLGSSWRGTHTVQYQLVRELAFRLGLNTRWERRIELADGTKERDSGGFILFTVPGVLYSPVMDLVLSLDVHVPTLNLLKGTHEEGPMFALGAAYDF